MSSFLSSLQLAAVGLRFGLHALNRLQGRSQTQSVRLAHVCGPDTWRICGQFAVPWTSDVPVVARFTPPAAV